MLPEEQVWRRCSTCKTPIGFAAPHYVCSVSTCNRRGTQFTFCSVECWDAHVPIFRHRESWAVEETAPTAEEWRRTQQAAAAPPARTAPERARPPAERGGSSMTIEQPEPPSGSAEPPPRDVLVVVSKLKRYIRHVSGLNTSDDVIAALSDRLRRLCDDAIVRARAAERKTVMARDFKE